MAKDSFIIYKSFYAPISSLSDKQLGKLFRSLFDFQINGNEFVEDDIKMAFSFFKNQMVLDEKKYQTVIERNKQNGVNGGRPKNTGKETQANPKNPVGFSKPKKPYNDNENVNDNENDNENEKLSARGGNDLFQTKHEPKQPKAKKEKSCAKKEKEIPAYEEFLAYAVQQRPNIDKEMVKMKYLSWVENQWRTGRDVEIKNWKSTLLNTMPYIPDSKPFIQQKGSGRSINDAMNTYNELKMQ